MYCILSMPLNKSAHYNLGKAAFMSGEFWKVSLKVALDLVHVFKNDFPFFTGWLINPVNYNTTVICFISWGHIVILESIRHGKMLQILIRVTSYINQINFVFVSCLLYAY